MENQSTNRLKVTIHGIDYTLRGSAPVEHLHSVANMVDQRMSEIAASSSYMDERRIAVLTALNLAEELQNLRAEYEDLVKLLDDQTRGTSK